MARKKSLISTLKARAASVARRAASLRPRPAAKASKAAAPAAPATPKPAAPIRRVSVVSKPTRGPERRPVQQTRMLPPAPPRASRQLKRTSVVRKPARSAASTSSRIARSAASHPTRASESVQRQPGFAGSDAVSAPPVPSAATARRPEETFSLPSGYGDDRIVLIVKDPWWLFAYWEIQPSTERAAHTQLLPQEVVGLQTILRVYDVTELDFPAQSAHRTFDISLSGLATNWYIHTNAPGRVFIVDIGLLTRAGRFLLLARSNRVSTPRFGPSEITDKAWMISDSAYWALLSMASGLGGGSSPGGWETLRAQQLLSGSGSSFALAAPTRTATVKGFWCRVNADLVIHGATAPQSAVVIQGQPASVRKDGTFSLRLALPEGTQSLTIDVTSPDGRHLKTVTPIVTMAWSGSLAPQEAA